MSDFNEILIFSTDFRKKNIPRSNFMGIRPVETRSFHGNGQTDGWT